MLEGLKIMMEDSGIVARGERRGNRQENEINMCVRREGVTANGGGHSHRWLRIRMKGKNQLT